MRELIANRHMRVSEKILYKVTGIYTKECKIIENYVGKQSNFSPHFLMPLKQVTETKLLPMFCGAYMQK